MLDLRPYLSLLGAAALLGTAAGCTGETFLTGPNSFGQGDDDDAPIEEEDFSEFDGATLVVHEPVSASIYMVDNGVPLDAEIISADGEVLDFDDIEWSTEGGDDPFFTGTDGDGELDWGIYTVTATADLPNGDRLQYGAGGIRVQGRQSGIYSGNMRITLAGDFQGTPISASCLGGLDFVIDMSGEVLGGGGGCTIDTIILGTFDVSYNVDAEVEGDEAHGDVGVDLGFFDLPVGFDGDFPEDGEMNAVFAGDALLFAFDGEMDAHRVSLYVDP